MERTTRQRQAIRKVLEEQARPLAPLQLLQAAQQYVPNLGLATVYRTLNTLVEEGIVTQVDLPGELAHYEITNNKHHHHFQCRQCGLVFDIDTCPKDLQLLTPQGFTLEHHEVVLYGLCTVCSVPSRRKRGASHRSQARQS